jgi:hypothetical protein
LGYGRNADHFDPGLGQPMREGAVIVACGFKTGACSASQVSNKSDQTLKVLCSIAHLEAVALASSCLDQDNIPVPCHINCNPVINSPNIGNVSHDSDLLRS